MKLAEKFLPKEKLQMLSNAYDMADKITNMTNNPREALEKAGVTKSDLEKAKQLINNPMAGFILGDKRQSVIDGLNKAESLFDNSLLAEQVPVNELEQMQKDLAMLK
jgi:hypothetical protein